MELFFHCDGKHYIVLNNLAGPLKAVVNEIAPVFILMSMLSLSFVSAKNDDLVELYIHGYRQGLHCVEQLCRIKTIWCCFRIIFDDTFVMLGAIWYFLLQVAIQRHAQELCTLYVKHTVHVLIIALKKLGSIIWSRLWQCHQVRIFSPNQRKMN